MKVEVMSIDTPHNGLCESLWRRDLPCPNAAEFIIRNKSNPGYAVMCGVHKDGFLSQYKGDDVTVEPYNPEAL